MGSSLRDAVVSAEARLSGAGCDTPRLDAELLLAFVLGCSRAQVVLLGTEELPADRVERFAEVVGRRAAREPVAYITGYKDFRRISLAVDARVLIPRPETELLVEVGLSLPARARVVDVGTGCGAVALALKDERSDLSVVGVDVSEDALAVARANAARLGLEVEFVRGDLLDAGGSYDAVLANLPYVASGTAESLPLEILRYEPPGALFAGADGLELIRRLVGSAGGASLLALEVGFDQADTVAELVGQAEFGRVERLRDLAGHERLVVGRR